MSSGGFSRDRGGHLTKEDLDHMLLDLLGDAICKSTGIDRKEHRKKTDAQVDKLKELECDVFHWGPFSDLIEGDTKAEGKALMNNLIPDSYNIENKVSDAQLRLTPYIYYKALYSLTKSRLDSYLANSKSSMVTQEHANKADEISKKIEGYIGSTVTDTLANKINKDTQQPRESVN